MVDSKKCTQCKATKSAMEFHIDNSSATGLTSQCKECKAAFVKDRREKNLNVVRKRTAESMMEWRRRNPGASQAMARSWRLKNLNRILLRQVRRRAKRDGLIFDLLPSDINIPDICPVLSIPLDPTGPRDNLPSVDRLLPDRGYIRGNISVISYRANRIKNDATLSELQKIVDWLKKASA